MRVLITGCSSGIGRATAVELTKRGHDVVATARTRSALDDLDVAERLPLDVDDDESVRGAVAQAGALDALVNNAGFGLHGPIESVPINAVRRMFETNVFGALRMIQAVLPSMRAQGSGTIVNISSSSGRVARPLSGAYAATKFALEAISEALLVEAGHFGVRTIVLQPGFISTRYQETAVAYGLGPDSVYAELQRQSDTIRDRLSDGAAPGPELVAGAVADAIEDPNAHGRIPVGKDAEMVMAARASMDDDTFLATMRQVLDLTW